MNEILLVNLDCRRHEVSNTLRREGDTIQGEISCAASEKKECLDARTQAKIFELFKKIIDGQIN